MSSIRPRATEGTDREAQPLLNGDAEPNENGDYHPESPSGPSWWFAFLSPTARSTSRHVTFSEEEDEEILPVSTAAAGKGKRRWGGYEQIGIYALLLLLGGLTGGLLVRLLYRPSVEGKGHGPLVPPVYTLPPVRM